MCIVLVVLLVVTVPLVQFLIQIDQILASLYIVAWKDLCQHVETDSLHLNP